MKSEVITYLIRAGHASDDIIKNLFMLLLLLIMRVLSHKNYVNPVRILFSLQFEWLSVCHFMPHYLIDNVASDYENFTGNKDYKPHRENFLIWIEIVGTIISATIAWS